MKLDVYHTTKSKRKKLFAKAGLDLHNYRLNTNDHDYAKLHLLRRNVVLVKGATLIGLTLAEIDYICDEIEKNEYAMIPQVHSQTP